MRARVPRLNVQPDAAALRGLPLTPLDGFVLSRIDGALDEEELASATGLSNDDVRACVDKLALHGLVSLPEQAPAASASPSPPLAPAASPAAPSPSPPSPPAPAPAEDVDLTPEHCARIDRLYAELDSLTHYELLEVDPTADKKAIKRQYYELAGAFHPDRFFRKRLGSYKPRMEAIFGQVTLAHDVLTSKERRAEYDVYLGDRATTRSVERAAPAAAAPPPPSAAPSAPQAPAAAAPSAGPAPTTPPAPSAPAPVAAPVSAGVPVDAQARRDALARRLLGARASIPPAPRSSPPKGGAPAASSSGSGEYRADALRRHYEERTQGARVGAVKRFTDAATQALAKGDAAAASASYRQALELLPNDPELRRALEHASKEADRKLAETYRRQAVYEEKNAQWKDAARSWSKLAKLVPDDAYVLDRAANAMAEASLLLHEASALAARAVQLEPSRAEYRATLGRVYLAAGLFKNARRELEAAQQQRPGDATILALLKRLPKPP